MTSAGVDGGEPALSREATANLLYAESEYRHGLFWGTAYRWGTIAVLVMYLPWLNAELREELGYWCVAFPLLGLVAVAIGAFLVFAEMARFQAVWREYGRARGDQYRPRWEFDSERLGRIANTRLMGSTSLGWLAVLAFPIVLIPIAILDAAALIMVAD